MTTITDNPVDSRPLVTIAGVDVTEFRDKGVLHDRRIWVVLSCGCKYDNSLPLRATVVPRPGEPDHCRGQHR